MSTTAPPAALFSPIELHALETTRDRAALRAQNHEPRRRLSATVRVVLSIFIEARLENDRISERLKVSR